MQLDNKEIHTFINMPNWLICFYWVLWYCFQETFINFGTNAFNYKGRNYDFQSKHENFELPESKVTDQFAINPSLILDLNQDTVYRFIGNTNRVAAETGKKINKNKNAKRIGYFGRGSVLTCSTRYGLDNNGTKRHIYLSCVMFKTISKPLGNFSENDFFF